MSLKIFRKKNIKNIPDHLSFYIGLFNNKPVTVAQVTYHSIDGNRFAYCSWGGTEKSYRKNRVLSAILETGIVDAANKNIKMAISCCQSNKISKNVHKKLGFKPIEGAELNWYSYDMSMLKYLLSFLNPYSYIKK